MIPLPIDTLLPRIIAAVRDHGAVVVVAPPGAGKTTRVPPALLDAGVANGGKILVLQPRRIAARATARRMAQERGGQVGGEIGYAVRFDRKISAKTRIEVLTEGLLTRRLQSDPFLEGVGCIVLDEIHERSLHADLALALLAEIRAEARPDLAIVVMSATLNSGPISAFLNNCPVVESAGRTYPVTITWDARVDDRRLDARVAAAVAEVMASLPPPTPAAPGHILVFLPGVAEIGWCLRSVKGVAGDSDVLPLHGSLSARAQDEALTPSRQRKIILATNVAETSLTIDGIAAVVDSGLARRPRFDAVLGVERLETVQISRAAAEQRAGRAGRTGPGHCRRLWLEHNHRGLRDFEPPAIAQLDLTRLTLEVRAWGSDPARFGWFEQPPTASLDHGDALLRRLGALVETGLTPLGQRLATLPLHPRLGCVLLAGQAGGTARLAANVAALASERDFLRRDAASRRADRGQSGASGTRGALSSSGESDLDLRLAVLNAVDSGQPYAAMRGRFGADVGILRRVMATRDQLLRAVGERANRQRRDDRRTPLKPDRPGQIAQNPGSTTAHIARLLLTGFPDRVGRRRVPRGRDLVLVGGRGAQLDRSSCVHDAELLLAVTIGANDRGRDPIVYAAVAVEPAALTTTEQLATHFDMEREAAVQHLETRYLDLTLHTRPAGAQRDAEALARCLAAATRAQPGRALKLDATTRGWITRLQWLAQVLPEEKLPTLHALMDQQHHDNNHSDDDNDDDDDDDDAQADGLDVIAHLCRDRRSWAQLRRADLIAELTAWLPWPQQQVLTKQAPLTWKLPCGVVAPVRYSADRAPVISAKAQHFFGLMETPSLARGRVNMVCELLAPNGRPTQVTSDLTAFWTTSWLEVRKDLRGRYPKHPWPERPTLEDARKGRRRRDR